MKINGHKISLTLVLSCAIAAASLLVWVGTIAADNADTKRRVTQVEERQKEDRKEIKENVKETQADVKDVKKDVEQIRILLEGMRRERVAR